MRYTTKSGLVLEGNLTQINETLSKLGEKKINGYWSESRQTYLLYSELADTHLKNAILKINQNWLNSLKTINDIEKFGSAFFNGMNRIDMAIYIELIQELRRRIEQGK